MVHDLYESFEPSFSPESKSPHYVVRYYRLNSRKSAKTFGIKKYGSQAVAEEKAWDFFYRSFSHLPDHRK